MAKKHFTSEIKEPENRICLHTVSGAAPTLLELLPPFEFGVYGLKKWSHGDLNPKFHHAMVA